MLTEKGAEVSAVIFDGASKNISMAEQLGCNIKRLETSFPTHQRPTKRCMSFLTSVICSSSQGLPLLIVQSSAPLVEKNIMGVCSCSA